MQNVEFGDLGRPKLLISNVIMQNVEFGDLGRFDPCQACPPESVPVVRRLSYPLSEPHEATEHVFERYRYGE